MAELLHAIQETAAVHRELRGLHDGRLLTSPWPLDEQALEFGITMPLLIAPLEPCRHNYSQRRDGHHGAAFPNDHPGLTYKPDTGNLIDERRVVRWSRIQETLRVLHNGGHAHFDHTPLPRDEHETFKAVLLHLAQYVPPHAVDVRGSKPRIVKLNEEQVAKLHRPGVLHVQDRMQWKIGFFCGKYIVKHGLEAVRYTTEAAQFLAADEVQRQRLGFAVMRLAAEAVLDPVEATYQTARNQRLISPAMPTRASRFMMKLFQNRQPDYFDQLAQNLAAA